MPTRAISSRILRTSERQSWPSSLPRPLAVDSIPWLTDSHTDGAASCFSPAASSLPEYFDRSKLKSFDMPLVSIFWTAFIVCSAERPRVEIAEPAEYRAAITVAGIASFRAPTPNPLSFPAVALEITPSSCSARPPAITRGASSSRPPPTTEMPPASAVKPSRALWAPGDMLPRASTTWSANFTIPRSGVWADDPILIMRVSHEPDRPSRSPLRLSMRAAAVVAAYP